MTQESESGSSSGASVEVWPPVDFSSYYKVTEQIDGQGELSYDLALPGTFSEVDLSTVRIGRHGGPNPADLEFRSELYRRIGAITVGAGRVEMAMKRLLLVLTLPRKAHFSTVDHTWTDLHKKLERQCDGSDSRRERLADVLRWGEEQDLKKRRDNAIHADWLDFAGCGVRRSRFDRRSNGVTLFASLRELDEDARLLFEYAERLDGLLGNDWVMARLPGPFVPRPDLTPIELLREK